MKQNIDIEELIAAARSVEADRKRQEKLAQMVDLWAAAPQTTMTAVSTGRHRTLWAVMGIAASLLLLATTAVMLSRQTSSPSAGTLIAAVPCLSLPDTGRSAEDVTDNGQKPFVPSAANAGGRLQSDVVTQSSRTAENDYLAERDDEVSKPHYEMRQEEDPLEEDTALPSDEEAPVELLADNKPSVYERRSTRLVQTAKKTVRTHTTAINQSSLEGLIAFAGTGTEIEIGKISF